MESVILTAFSIGFVSYFIWHVITKKVEPAAVAKDNTSSVDLIASVELPLSETIPSDFYKAELEKLYPIGSRITIVDRMDDNWC